MSTNSDQDVMLNITLRKSKIKMGMNQPITQTVVPTTAATYSFAYDNAIDTFRSSALILHVYTESEGCFIVSIQQPKVSQFFISKLD